LGRRKEERGGCREIFSEKEGEGLMEEFIEDKRMVYLLRL
jgi:hypothetical protein